MSLDNWEDGDLCPRGCGVPVERVHREHPNMKGPPYHVCPRAPWALIPALVKKHLAEVRKEHGKEAARELNEYVREMFTP